MKIRLRHLWYHVTASFWFIPSLVATTAIASSFGMIALDGLLAKTMLQKFGWIYSGGPESSISVLSAIASSTVTVAGVVFSITVVALTLASSQFGPRLLGNFMRDRTNQIVLGIFIATFLYCLLILRSIRRDEPFVPHLAITLGIFLALLSFFYVIYFIHHVASSIKAENIIALVERDLERITDELYPENIGNETKTGDAEAPYRPQELLEAYGTIAAAGTGYVQAVDADRIMSIARERDIAVLLKVRPGDFLTEGEVLARVWPADAASGDLAASLNSQFILGRQRTPVQDIEMCINQLVEIAIRALSPGINDTFTAIVCIDRLGSALCRLASRAIPSPYRYDQEGSLRIIAYPTSFPGAVDAAFNLIRQNANIPVMIRLLETLGSIAGRTLESEKRHALIRQARMVMWTAERREMPPDDLGDIKARFEITMQACGDPD